MRRNPLTSSLAVLVLSSPLVLACGNDLQTKLIQVDDKVTGEHLLPAPTDGSECITSAHCEDGDLCTENRCVDRVCIDFTLPTEECCETEVLFVEGFDGTIAEGVSFTQLNGEAGWHVLKDRAASPPGALYFGDPDSMSYDVGVQVAGEVALPAMDLPADREVVLTMRIYALIETSPEFDHFSIEADVIENGVVSTTREVLAKRNLPVEAYQDFALVSADLEGLSGRRVVVRIRFDSIDGMNNAYEGIWIDDLQLLASCPLAVAVCEIDADCADDDPCSASACSDEGCLYTNVCTLPDPDPVDDIVDADPCAADDAPADCCTSDADCDDGLAATIDVCEGGSCVHTLNPDSCVTPADCDDDEVCTTETCNDGLCSYAGTIGAGCCVPGTFHIADFDNETLQGLYVTDNFETGVFWRPDKTRSTSPHYALYCGDPVTQSYRAERRVKSSATTRPFEVSKGGQARVEFDLYKRTRLAKNYDVFQVMVLRDGALLPAWTSKSLKDGTTAGSWQRITVPLGDFAGQTIQLRFVFDSVDTPSGLFEGVYIDSIDVETVCQ